ncbi:hypothetical protein [Riemerella columbina]|uniref:hypothetical protein n=1 Tax=Riemerella columbina TaxID=103810 RepID=UPI000362815E|nr:hypothetical protein [Riemerella columbina]
MKNFIKNIILFTCYILLFYIIVTPLWCFVMPNFMAKNVRNCVGCYGHLFSRVRDAEKVKNPDILFLGSSHAYRGFDTRVFSKHGITSFNLGSSAQTPINTKVLLHQYLDKIQPKMIVYEVYAGTLTSDGVESSLDLLSNNKININSVKMTLEINKITTYNTLLYGMFRQVFNLNDGFYENPNQGGNHYVLGGGFVQSDFRKNPLESEKVEEWKLNPKQINALKENIEFIKERNIPYILVQAPISQKLYNARTNNKEVDSTLAQLGTYKNFYGEIKLNDTIDFYDSNHLNQNAVVKFNEKFITYLKTINFAN